MTEETTSGVRIVPTHEGPGGQASAPVVEPEAAAPKAVPTVVATVSPVKSAPATPPAPEPAVTLAEWVAAGYMAENYPPQGYAPKAPEGPNGSTPPVALRPAHQGEVPRPGRA
jgi:hypothetical protein